MKLELNTPISFKYNKIMAKKIIGFNYLHRHSEIEKLSDLDIEHVIIDRKDWEEVVNYFHKYPNEIEKLGN